MLGEAETWVAVAFVIFVGVLIYYGVHTMVTGALDQRSARIRTDLDEARRLKEEAAALLAEYRRKQQTAEREAAGIVAGARAEADRLAVEARTRMDEFVARRTKMAETKIAQAEAQALADVRAAAAEAAVAAAEKILTQTVKGSVADDFIIINEPDVWMINLEDNTARHVIDPGPTFNCKLPVFALDPEMLKTKIGELEFGHELEFFRSNGAKRIDGPKLSFDTNYHELKIEDTVLILVEIVNTHVPVRIGYARGDKKYMIKYLLWDDQVSFKAAVFAKPDGVKIEEAK